MSKKIVIIDYGVGNVHSVYNALHLLGYKAQVSGNAKEIDNAAALILPGVGAFEIAINNLTKSGLRGILEEQVLEKGKPILGICLGMQLFAETSSENGLHKGLGWIKGNVVKLNLPEGFSVPHVGWNNTIVEKPTSLFDRLSGEPQFYYDHSYHFQCTQDNLAAYCNYGIKVTSAVVKDNIYGVQFHPEKSQTAGLKLFRGFFNMVFENNTTVYA